jgi:hypothetical protein
VEALPSVPLAQPTPPAPPSLFIVPEFVRAPDETMIISAPSPPSQPLPPFPPLPVPVLVAAQPAPPAPPAPP